MPPANKSNPVGPYPSSDLYSLAVTAVVLLSGRKPQELFDDLTLSWQWQEYVQPPVRKEFAYILNRMLSHRPGQRYQFAREVTYAFDELKRYHLPEAIASPPVKDRSSNERQPTVPNFSEMNTVAVSQPPINREGGTGNQSTPIISGPDDNNPLLESPLAIAALLVVVSLFTGITSWLVVMAFIKPQSPVQQETTVLTDPNTPTPSLTPDPNSTTPTTTPTETLTPTPTETPTPTSDTKPTPTPDAKPTQTPTPTPTPVTKPTIYNQPVDIRLGVPLVFDGNLKANEGVNYKIQGQAGEELLTFVSGQGVLMTLNGPNGDMSQNVSMWEGALPATGEYSIQLRPLPELRGQQL